MSNIEIRSVKENKNRAINFYSSAKNQIIVTETDKT